MSGLEFLLLLFAYSAVKAFLIWQVLDYTVFLKSFWLAFIKSPFTNALFIVISTGGLYYWFMDNSWIWRWTARDGKLFFSGVILTVLFYKVANRNKNERKQDEIDREWDKTLMSSSVIRIK